MAKPDINFKYSFSNMTHPKKIVIAEPSASNGIQSDRDTAEDYSNR